VNRALHAFENQPDVSGRVCVGRKPCHPAPRLGERLFAVCSQCEVCSPSERRQTGPVSPGASRLRNRSTPNAARSGLPRGRDRCRCDTRRTSIRRNPDRDRRETAEAGYRGARGLETAKTIGSIDGLNDTASCYGRHSIKLSSNRAACGLSASHVISRAKPSASRRLGFVRMRLSSSASRRQAPGGSAATLRLSRSRRT
jgi:hypothetical protein